MTSPKLSQIRDSIHSKYGISFVVSYSEKEGVPTLILDPLDLKENEGFKIVMTLDWRAFIAYIQFGAFSSPLIRNMGELANKRREIYKIYSNQIQTNGAEIKVSINGESVDSLNISKWTSLWSKFDIKVIHKYVVIDKENIDEMTGFFDKWCILSVGLFSSLLPIEETHKDIFELDIFPFGSSEEGEKEKIVVNRYERSLLNRQASIAYHGVNCKVCGFSFEEKYHSLGKDYIHVHHIIPLSQLGENYIVNPREDLIPLCPNCHAMVHKTTPPLTIEELKTIIRNDGH